MKIYVVYTKKSNMKKSEATLVTKDFQETLEYIYLHLRTEDDKFDDLDVFDNHDGFLYRYEDISDNQRANMTLEELENDILLKEKMIAR